MGIFNFLKSNSEHRKSIRVNTNIGDKYININLGQTYESMDILSLKIFQKDLYRLFDADYGIIVGRVLGQGVGIPNAKVSVFIPLDEEDITSPTTLEDIKKIEATALYPFQTVFDKDGNGKVYNLLPKYARNRNVNGFPDNPYGIGATPKTPVGTFPEKDEILVNETVAYVYDKYLKFTTVTNESGDYILTVPANKSYNVNMSCDITDIGRFSTCAALLKLDGYPDNFFSEDGRTLNEEIELERLPNIDIQNNSITVKPLWSQNISNSNVGINRLDFNLVKKIKPFVTIIGNQFTQNSRAWWGDKVQFRFIIGIRALCFTVAGVNVRIPGILPFFRLNVFARKMCTLNGGKGDYEPFEMKTINAYNECDKEAAESILTEGLSDDIFISSHVKGDLDIKLFNIKNTVPESDAQILNGETKANIANTDPIFNNYSYNTDIELYDKNKYIYYQNQGSFLFLINCNRNKVITNENGDLIPVDDNSEKGVFTSFRGYFYVTNLSDVDNPPTRYRVGKVRLKVPQLFDYAQTNKWIWKHFKFDFGKIYSVAQNTKVRYSQMSTENESVDDYTLPDEPNPPNPPQGFATQTNLFLFGEREIGDSEPVPSFVENHNTGYTSYVNSYNHIVSLGTDTANLNSSEIITNINQNDVGGLPPQFNFKMALFDNIPVDSLTQEPIPGFTFTRTYSMITGEYDYSVLSSFDIPQINFEILINDANLSLSNWQIQSASFLRTNSSIATPIKFDSLPNISSSWNYFSGIFSTGPINTPTPQPYLDGNGTVVPNKYKIMNPLNKNQPEKYSYIQKIVRALAGTFSTDYFVADGYYIIKLTLSSSNASQANVTPENTTKGQYYHIKIQ